MPLAAASKSSTAMSAATLDPGPANAAYGPDSSFRTPILTMPSEIWASTCPGARLSRAKSSANAATYLRDLRPTGLAGLRPSVLEHAVELTIPPHATGRMLPRVGGNAKWRVVESSKADSLHVAQVATGRWNDCLAFSAGEWLL